MARTDGQRTTANATSLVVALKDLSQTIPYPEETGHMNASTGNPYSGTFTPGASGNPAGGPLSRGPDGTMTPVPGQPIPGNLCTPISGTDCGDAISPPATCATTDAVYTKGATSAAVQGLTCDQGTACTPDRICDALNAADRFLPATIITGTASELEDSDFAGAVMRNVALVRSIIELSPQFQRVPAQVEGNSLTIAGVLTYYVYIPAPYSGDPALPARAQSPWTNEGFAALWLEISGTLLTSQATNIVITTATVYTANQLFVGSAVNAPPVTKMGQESVPRTMSAKVKPMANGGVLARFYLMNALRQTIPNSSVSTTTPVCKIAEHGVVTSGEPAATTVAPIVITVTGLPSGMSLRGQKVGAETTPMAALTGLIERPELWG